jgi:hypothetical protein
MSQTRYFFLGESVGLLSGGILKTIIYRVLPATAAISQKIIGIYLHAKLTKFPYFLHGRKTLTGPIKAPPTIFEMRLNQWNALQYGDCFLGWSIGTLIKFSPSSDGFCLSFSHASIVWFLFFSFPNRTYLSILIISNLL